MKAAITTIALLVAATTAQLEYTTCQDGACSVGCTSTPLSPATCTELQTASTTGLSAIVKPESSEAGCWSFKVFDSKDCTTSSMGEVLLGGVCNTCSNQLLGTCGALPGTIVFSYNCPGQSDGTCGNCVTTQRLIYGQCTQLPLFSLAGYPGYIYAMPVWGTLSTCTFAKVNVFNDQDCSGTGSATNWPLGVCMTGKKLSAASNSTISLH
eukprot:GILI01023865.1.p1 GENE.GILI01023865.1~~GILI01023865.1.p1  ORF type:complete len:210 (+),score=25.02 GILI01023865.1:47-676(+)